MITRMALREAAAALLPAPRVEWGASGASVRVRVVECPSCGASADEDPAAPFRADLPPGPVLRMLSCESVTARAVLPIIVMAERSPVLAEAEFMTRGLTWLDVAHLDLGEALAAVDAAETWLTDPDGAPGRTLPASTRRRAPAAIWPERRERLVPSLMSPHPSVPEPLERRYAGERRTAIVDGYRRIRP